MTQQAMNIEYDNLKGNINRMCVTNNLSEMLDMYEYAQKRLDKIYQYNKDRLLGKENKQYPFIDLPSMECDNNGNYIYFRENK